MSQKTCILLVLFVISLVSYADLRLSTNGKTDYVIAGDPASMEIRELKYHLEKITGAVFPVVKENAVPRGKKVIYVGNTAFAKKNGIDFLKFKPETWLYKTVGNDLIVGGHPHHGNIYAVAELLENEFGCRWYNFESEKIPRNRNLTLKSGERKGVPVFLSRQITEGGGLENGFVGDYLRRYQRFILLNKGNIDMTVYNARTKHILNCHNLYQLLPPDKYFKSHPEYYSMNALGQRFHGNAATRAGGSVCMSNPEVARVAAENLARIIELNHKELPRGEWPLIYSIQGLDATAYVCLCPECDKISPDKSMRDDNLTFLFVNRMAKHIGRKYPQITLMISLKHMPHQMKMEPNVAIQYSHSFTQKDCYRPITHPINAHIKKEIDIWLKTGQCLGIWDYWNMATKKGTFFATPRIETMLDAIAPSYRYYLKHGLKWAFIEAQYCYYWHPPTFHALEVWLGHKILDKPDADEKMLIADFMQGHYGPAAKVMTEYLNLVRKAVAEEKRAMVALNYVHRSYQTPAFLKKCYDLLHKALKQVPQNSAYARRIRGEMITPLATILHYKNLKTGLDRNRIIAEYATARKEQVNAWGDAQLKADMIKEIDADIQKMNSIEEVPTPAFLKHVPETQLIKFGWDHLTYRDSNKYVEKDPDSVLGKSLGTPPPSDRLHHGLKKPFSGMYSSTIGVGYWTGNVPGISRTITKFPNDEKFHWYKIGNFEFLPGRVTLNMWWCEMQCNLSGVYIPPDSGNDINIYDVYVSLKFVGPTYVPASKKKDRIHVDRVILVRTGQKKK